MNIKNNSREIKNNHKIEDFFKLKRTDTNKNPFSAEVLNLSTKKEVINSASFDSNSSKQNRSKPTLTSNSSNIKWSLNNINIFSELQKLDNKRSKFDRVSDSEDSDSSELSSIHQQDEDNSIKDSDLSFNNCEINSVENCLNEEFSSIDHEEKFCTKSMNNFNERFTDEESKSIFRLSNMQKNKDPTKNSNFEFILKQENRYAVDELIQFRPKANNCMLTCNLCHSSIHVKCYAKEVKINQIKNWRCERCIFLIQHSFEAEEITCKFCPHLKGIIVRLNQNDELWAHMICIDFLSFIKFTDCESRMIRTRYNSNYQLK